MSQCAKAENAVAQQRARILATFEKMLDRYLPETGLLRPWKLAEFESALSADSYKLSRELLEARLEVDPLREGERALRCPECGGAMAGDPARKAHKKTIFGPIYYTRGYGYCRSCEAAFSPSGESVGLRQGLL
jgi:hypothetical protein